MKRVESFSESAACMQSASAADYILTVVSSPEMFCPGVGGGEITSSTVINTEKSIALYSLTCLCT